MVENSSPASVPGLPMGTLLILKATESRTTTTKSGSYRENLEWAIERNLKSEIIPNRRKGQGGNKEIKELRYMVQWKGCGEDEQTWEPPEYSKNGQEEVDQFHRESPEMLGPADVEQPERFSICGQVNAGGF